MTDVQIFFFFKQKTAYEMRISDWSSDVCSSDLQVTEIKHKIDANTQEELAAKHLELNEVAQVNLYLDQPVAFEKYADSRDLGAFILIDRQTNGTVAAGNLDFALRRAGNIHWQHLDVAIGRAHV